MIVFLVLTSGCKTTDIVYKTEIEYVFIKPSNALLEECNPLEEKEIKTNGDLLSAYSNLIFDYLICANKVKALKQFFLEYKQDTDTQN